MKKETIFKTVGIAAFGVALFAVGTTAYAIYKRRSAEEEIIEATAEAAALNENFSGAAGPFGKSRYTVGFNQRGVPVIKGILINRPNDGSGIQSLAGKCTPPQVYSKHYGGCISPLKGGTLGT